MTAQTLDASVVVPTYKRDDLLERLLERLAAQAYPRERFEIIVVDDACSTTVPGRIAAFSRRHADVAITLLPGRGRGPATARNIGWRAAQGAVIAFIDDDAYPLDERWLLDGLSALAEAGADGVSGRVVVPVGSPPTDYQRNVQGLERGEFLTCNAFYRRAVLAAVEGFDERFTVPYREDSDLQFRVEARGGRLVKRDVPVVIHPAPRGRFAISLRLQRGSMFNALIYKKHPRRFRRDLERRPPLHYYAMLSCFAGALVAFACGKSRAGRLLLAGWALLEGRFFFRRARSTSHHPRHVLDLALTSVLIPPLSVYWRLRGAIRFRVAFM